MADLPTTKNRMQQAPAPVGFPALVRETKARIRQAQTRAIFAANAELIRLYWSIGRLIGERQEREGLDDAVVRRLARELKNELAEVKGFSERNLKLMVQFAREYPDAFSGAVEEGHPTVAHIPWAHHVLLMQRVPDRGARSWYAEQTLVNGWSRSTLLAMIQSQAHRRRKGRA